MPWWGLFVNIVFFGAAPYFALRAMQRDGVTARSMRTWFIGYLLLDFLIEQPIIHTELYHYYGDPPMEVLGFPVYWMFINAGGPMLEATVLFAAPHFFRGARALLILPLGMVADVACSTAVGWPIFSAPNDAPTAVKYGAALGTVALRIAVMQAITALAVSASQRREHAAQGGDEIRMISPAHHGVAE